MKVVGIKKLVVIAVLVVGGVAVTAFTSKVNTSSEAGIELDLPEQVDVWRGERIEQSDLEKKLLPAGTLSYKRVYSNEANDILYCSIVLSSPDPRSIHRAELCLQAQGVRVASNKEISLPVQGLDKKLPVMQLGTTTPLIGKDGRPLQDADGHRAIARGYFYYWFVGKDRITAQHYQRILWNMWDRVIFNTNHRWAYIIVQGSVTESLPPQLRQSVPARNDEETRATLTKFIQDIFPHINRTKTLRE